MSEDHSIPGPLSESGRQYFSFLAEMGVTKHFGSHNVTLELVELCHVDEKKYVLDVGCGVGATPSFLAREVGCRVVGVDVIPRMIERAQERVAREGVADRVELRVADARTLPFEEGCFDAVICESVIVFLEDKQRAVDELVRVTRPGGYVGLTEVTLLRPTDDAELMAYMARVAGIQGEMLPQEAWAQYLREAGLEEVVARACRLDLREEARARLRRYPMRDLLASLARLPRMWLGDPASKAFLKETVGGTRHLKKETFEYMGYGVYVGKK